MNVLTYFFMLCSPKERVHYDLILGKRNFTHKHFFSLIVASVRRLLICFH